MDLLVCPNCERRSAVRDGGDGAGWRCTGCDTELRTVERAESGAPLRIAVVADRRLRYLNPLPDLADPH